MHNLGNTYGPIYTVYKRRLAMFSYDNVFVQDKIV